MQLRRLWLTDFRSYEAAEITLAPGLTAVVGDNGQGKSNLLEAVAYLATLSSFRGAPTEALVRQGASAAVVRADLTSGQEVRTPSGTIHPDGAAAIGPEGRFVVFAAKGPVHTRDLFLVRRAGETWSAPENLTDAGRHAYNKQPALSPDGRWLAFDCGPDPYGQEGTATCVLDVERPVPTERWSPGQAPLDDAVAIHHPGWERDGSLLLEIKRKSDGERVYRLRPGATAPEPFGAWTNDNAPCALPDGRIATLWLNRPENRAGLHELKVMSEDGKTGFGLVVDVDIVDTGTFCATRR